MWQEIGKLFTTIQIVPVIFILIGLVFCIIEIFKSKFSSFGIFGGIFIIASLIAVMMLKGTSTQFIFLIVSVFLVIIASFCIMTIVTENGKFFYKKSKKLEQNVDENTKEDEEKTLNKLVGKIGVASTELNPEGKVQVNGISLNATTSGEKIEKNSQIKIVKIDGIKILVKGIEIDVK